MRALQPSLVRCADCGGWYELSANKVRAHTRQGVGHRCPECRGRRPPSQEQVEAAKAWWLAQYDLVELRNWPPLGW